MKRTLLLVLGALGLVVVAALVLIRLPATQRWALHRAAAGVPGLALQVDAVSAGLGAAELDGISLTYEGTTVRLPHLVAQYDGWRLLTRRELLLTQLEANDVQVTLATPDAAAPGQPAAAALSPAAAGLLAPLQLPLRATVTGVQIGGRLRVSAAQELTFSAQGALLQPGTTAGLDLAATWSDRTPAALAANLDWVGRLAVRTSATGLVERVELAGSLAVPTASKTAATPGLITRAVAAREADGVETIEVEARLSTAKDREAPLILASLRQSPDASRPKGQWQVALRREQFAGILDLERLPDFSAEGQGTFELAPASGDFAAEGRATVAVAKLQRFRRELAPLGALTAQAEFAAERRGDELRLARLTASVSDGRAPVLTVALLQPVNYRFDTQAVAFGDATQDLARVELAGVPLTWAQPWLADATLGGTLAAGELRLKGAGSAWSVVTTRPFTFSGVRFGRGGQAWADQLGGELAVRASVDGAAWKLEQLSLALRSAAQPSPGAIQLRLEAGQDAAGQGRFQLPFTLEVADRKTQLTLAGDWRVSAGERQLSAQLSGDTVHLRDLAGLAAFLPKPEAAAEKPGQPGPGSAAKRIATKDAAPFWAGLEARATIDLRRLVLDSEEVTGLQATLVADARHLALERLVGRTKQAPLEANATLAFDATKPSPYTLQGACRFPGFDLGAWMRAAHPGEEPMIETVLDVTAKLEGQGGTLDEVIERVRGDFSVSGGPGVLRIKDKRVETASALGGLVLGLLSKERQQKAAVVAGSQLLEEMRVFRFDRLEAALARGEDLNLQFKTIDVRSAEKRLSGSGTAQHVAGRTIDAYPLRLELRLAGKGNFGVLLDKAGLLGTGQDELGYQRLREPFTVTGTVGEPDWKRLLAQLAAGLALGG